MKMMAVIVFVSGRGREVFSEWLTGPFRDQQDGSRSYQSLRKKVSYRGQKLNK